MQPLLSGSVPAPFSQNTRPIPIWDLPRLGLSELEVAKICAFVSNPVNFNALKDRGHDFPVHIRKNKENELPRSIVFVPGSQEKLDQVFILLKEKGVEKIGEGYFTTATQTVGFDLKNGLLSGLAKEKVFLASALDLQEVECLRLMRSLNYCMTPAAIVVYQGDLQRKIGSTTNTAKMGLIVDRMEGGDFAEFLRTTTSPSAKGMDHATLLPRLKVLRDTARGLNELHDRGLVHNDVKADNILLNSQGHGKIADFGLTRKAHKCPGIVAKVSAPEVHRDPSNPSNWSAANDVFGLGLTLCGALGFPGFAMEYFMFVQGGENPVKCAEEIVDRLRKYHSGPIAELIADCLEAAPERRISSLEATMRLEALMNGVSLQDQLGNLQSTVNSDQPTVTTTLLKNGTTCPEELLIPVMKALRQAGKTEGALECLMLKCRDLPLNKKTAEKMVSALKGVGLVTDDGSVPELVKRVALSAMMDDDPRANLCLHSPISPAEERRIGKQIFPIPHPEDEEWQRGITSASSPQDKEEMLEIRFKQIEEGFKQLDSLLEEFTTKNEQPRKVEEPPKTANEPSVNVGVILIDESLQKQADAVKANKEELSKDAKGPRGEIDPAKVAEKLACSVVNAAASFIRNQTEMRHLSSNVRSFIDGYEREKRRLGQEIPRDNEPLLQEDLQTYFDHVITPAQVRSSLRDLDQAERELTKARQDLATARQDLQSEQVKVNRDLKMIDIKEQKCKRALKKALRSAKRAANRSSIVSTILNAAAGVMMVIPGTQVVGASLMAATNLAGAAVDHNRNKIADNRISRQQGKLQDLLMERRDLLSQSRSLELRLLEVEETDRAICLWIRSDASTGELSSSGKLTLLQQLINESSSVARKVNDDLTTKQNKQQELQKDWNDRESELNSYRDTPGGQPRGNLSSKERSYYNQLNARQNAHIDPLQAVNSEVATLTTARANAENHATQDARLLRRAQDQAPLNVLIEQMDHANLSPEERRVIELRKALEHPNEQMKQQQQEELNKLEDLLSHRERLAVAIHTLNHNSFQQNAAFLQLGAASSSLAFEIDRMTGTQLCGSGVMLIRKLHELQMCAQLCEENEKALAAFRAAVSNGGNAGASPGKGVDIITKLIPYVRWGAALLGAGAAAIAIGAEVVYRYKNWGKSFITAEQYMIQMMECLPRCFESVHQHIHEQFVAVHKGMEHYHKVQMAELQAAREEIAFLGKELIETIDRSTHKLSAELSTSQFRNKVQEEERRVAHIKKESQLLSTSFRSKEDLLRYFTWIKATLREAKKGFANGYLKEIEVGAGRRHQPLIELKHAFRNPSYFSGLLSKEMDHIYTVHNLAELLVLGNEFLRVQTMLATDEPNLLRDPDVARPMEEISQSILHAAAQIESLGEEIEGLCLTLVEKQIRLRQRILGNIAKVENFETQTRQKLEAAAADLFPPLRKEDLLTRRERLFIRHLVTQPLSTWIPEYNYPALGVESTNQHAYISKKEGDLVKTAICFASFVNPVTAIGGGLTLLARGSKILYSNRMGTAIIRDLKHSLKALIDAEVSPSQPSSWVKEGKVTLSPIRVEQMGISLAERKIVKIDPNSMPPYVAPLCTFKLFLQYYFIETNEEYFELTLDDNGVLNKEALEQIAAPILRTGLGRTVVEDYQKFLNGLATRRFDAIKESSEILVSKQPGSQIRLAFPKKLLRKLEESISIEREYFRKTGIGSIIPYYEFSSERGTLVIGYRFWSMQSSETTPFCEFLIARFDPITLQSFVKNLVTEEGKIERELREPSDFLIRALYGFELPGNQTQVLREGFIAPSELPFPGCFALWEKDPSLMIDFHHKRYDKQSVSDLDSFIKGGSQPPQNICVVRPEPLFCREYYSLWRAVREAKERLVHDPDYDRNHALLLGMINLCCNPDMVQLQGKLEGQYGLYAPGERAHFLERHEILVSEGIEKFAAELRTTPSKQLQALRTLVQKIQASTAF